MGSPLLNLLRTRTAALILAAALFADWCTLPRSTLFGAFHDAFSGVTRCYFPAHAIVHRTESGALVLSDAPLDDARRVGSIMYAPRSRDTGLWAPTRHVNRRVLDLPQGLTPAEAAQLRAAFADYLVATGDRRAGDAPTIKAGDLLTSKLIPLGFAHNLIPTLCIAGLIVSLRSRHQWEPLFMHPVTRRKRALAAGRCPACGYPTANLPRGAVCPECGDNLKQWRWSDYGA